MKCFFVGFFHEMTCAPPQALVSVDVDSKQIYIWDNCLCSPHRIVELKIKSLCFITCFYISHVYEALAFHYRYLTFDQIFFILSSFFFMEYELRSTARSDQIFNTLYALHGWIQDFVLGGTKVGEGSGDCLRFPSGPGQSRGRGPRGIPPGAPGFWVFRKLFRQQFCSILWMWWNVLKRMNLLQKVSNSF